MGRTSWDGEGAGLKELLPSRGEALRSRWWACCKMVGKSKSLSNGQNLEQSTEKLKSYLLDILLLTFEKMYTCTVCLCVYMCLCLYLPMSQVVKPGGKYPYMLGHHTILSTALLMKKNNDAVNGILQFILKLNFYVLRNAKCQLYSIIHDSFLTLKFLCASLIYFSLLAMIDWSYCCLCFFEFLNPSCQIIGISLFVLFLGWLLSLHE